MAKKNVSISSICENVDFTTWSEPHEVNLTVTPEGLGITIKTIRSRCSSETFTLVTQVKSICSLQNKEVLTSGQRITQVEKEDIQFATESHILKLIKGLTRFKRSIELKVSFPNNTKAYGNDVKKCSSYGTLSSEDPSVEPECINDFQLDEHSVSATRFDDLSDHRFNIDFGAHTQYAFPSIPRSNSPSVLSKDLSLAVNEINDAGYDSDTISTVSHSSLSVASNTTSVMKEQVAISQKSGGIALRNGQVSPAEEEILTLKACAVTSPEKIQWSINTKKIEMKKDRNQKYGFHYTVKKNSRVVFYIVDKVMGPPAKDHLQIGDWIRSANSKALDNAPRENEWDDLKKEVLTSENTITLIVQRPEKIIKKNYAATPSISTKNSLQSTCADNTVLKTDSKSTITSSTDDAINMEDINIDRLSVTPQTLTCMSLPGQVESMYRCGCGFGCTEATRLNHNCSYHVTPIKHYSHNNYFKNSCNCSKHCLHRQYSDGAQLETLPSPKCISLPSNFTIERNIPTLKILEDAWKKIGMLHTLPRVPSVNIIFASVHDHVTAGIFNDYAHKLGFKSLVSNSVFKEYSGTFLVDSSGLSILNSDQNICDLILANQLVDNVEGKLCIEDLHLNGYSEFKGVPLSLIDEISQDHAISRTVKSYVQIRLMMLTETDNSNSWPCTSFTRNSIIVVPVDCYQFHQDNRFMLAKMQSILSKVKMYAKSGKRVIFTAVRDQQLKELQPYIQMDEEIEKLTVKNAFHDIVVLNEKTLRPLFLLEYGISSLFEEIAKILDKQSIFTPCFPVAAVAAAQLLRQKYCSHNGVCSMDVTAAEELIQDSIGQLEKNKLTEVFKALHDSHFILFSDCLKHIIHNVNKFYESVQLVQQHFKNRGTWHLTIQRIHEILRDMRETDKRWDVDKVISWAESLHFADKCNIADDHLNNNIAENHLCFLVDGYQEHKTTVDGQCLWIDFHTFMPQSYFMKIMKQMQQACSGSLRFKSPMCGFISCPDFDFQIDLYIPKYCVGMMLPECYASVPVKLKMRRERSDFYQFLKDQLCNIADKYKITFHIGPQCPRCCFEQRFHILHLEDPMCSYCSQIFTDKCEISSWVPTVKLSNEQKVQVMKQNGIRTFLHQLPNEISELVCDHFEASTDGLQRLAESRGCTVSSLRKLSHTSEPSREVLHQWGTEGGTLHQFMVHLANLKQFALLQELIIALQKLYSIPVDVEQYPGLINILETDC